MYLLRLAVRLLLRAMLVGALGAACAHRAQPPPASPPPPDPGVVAGARQALESALASRKARTVTRLFDPALVKLRQWSDANVPRALDPIQVTLTPAAMTGDEVLVRMKLHTGRVRGLSGHASWEQVLVVAPDDKTGWKFRQATPAAVEQLRVDGWRRDIAVLRSELPRLHVNAFFETSRAQFNGKLAGLEGAVPRLEDHQLAVGLMTAVAQLGDAHTHVRTEFDRVGLELEWFSDGVFVTRAARPHGNLRRGRLLRVGTVPIEQAVARVRTVFPWDNDSGVRFEAPLFLTQPQVLHAVGLAARPDGALYTVELGDGRELNVELRLPPPDSELRWGPDVSPRPVRRQHPDRPFWFQRLPGSRALYLKYDRCRDPEPFRALTRKLFAAIDAGRPGARPDRLIVDLRDNGGGDSSVIEPLIVGLEQRRGKPGLAVFGLIGPKTFSSGMWAAIDLRKRAGATLVGEPTSGKPNSPGEVRVLRLPWSGLEVQYSTRNWQRDPDADLPAVFPDLPAVPSVSDHRAGRDVALNLALGRLPARSTAALAPVAASRPGR